MTVSARTDAHTRRIGERIGQRLEPGAIILLQGPLGAGKTTLAKGIARGLGVTETVTSPTYTIVSDYEGRLSLHHIDLYRLTGSEEYELLGLDDLLYADAVSLIEWPDRAGEQIPGASAAIEIRIAPDGSRLITGPETLLAPAPEEASAQEGASADRPDDQGEQT